MQKLDQRVRFCSDYQQSSFFPAILTSSKSAGDVRRTCHCLPPQNRCKRGYGENISAMSVYGSSCLLRVCVCVCVHMPIQVDGGEMLLAVLSKYVAHWNCFAELRAGLFNPACSPFLFQTYVLLFQQKTGLPLCTDPSFLDILGL